MVNLVSLCFCFLKIKLHWFNIVFFHYGGKGVKYKLGSFQDDTNKFFEMSDDLLNGQKCKHLVYT